MLSGRRFRLTTPTMAVLIVEGKRQSITLPSGATISVTADNQEGPNALVSVVFEGQRVQMFAEDVRSRGDEIPSTA